MMKYFKKIRTIYQLSFKFLITLIIILINQQSWSQSIDFLQAQNKVLEANFKLKALHQQIEQYKLRIPQDSSLPDPKLKLGLNNIPVNKPSLNESEMTSKEIGIYQMVPLFGKLSVKERIAHLEYKKALEIYRLYQAYYLNAVRSYIFEIAYLTENVRITEEAKQYLTMLLDIQKSKSTAGIGMLSDVLKVSVELSKLDEDIITAKTTIAETQRNIAYLLGDSNGDIKCQITDIDFTAVKMEKQFDSSLSEVIINENPELQLLSIQLLIDQEGVNLKQKDLYPDMEVGVSYMQRDKSPQGVSRDDMFSVMATFNIPLWFNSKNIPAIKEMEIKKGESQALYHDKINEINLALSTIFLNIEKWKQLNQLYSHRVLPQLDTMLKTDIAYYRTGNVEIMKILDTIRMRLDYKKQVLAIIKEYYKAISFLHFLRGDTSILDWAGMQ